MPLARFERERRHFLPAHRQPSFLTDANVSRIVARDWLVSFRTNRYSVPCRLIGQAVAVQARGDRVEITHRGRVVADHRLRTGQHELVIDPVHGPGAAAAMRESATATTAFVPGPIRWPWTWRSGTWPCTTPWSTAP